VTQPQSQGPQALIQFIVGRAGHFAGGVSRIRLIKFLYLADVHWFALREHRATPYPWRFYHYGPWTLEAQQDIERCVAAQLILPETLSRADDTGEMTIYRPGRSVLEPEMEMSSVFGRALEESLEVEIRKWLRAPLPLFLNYVYFETPPMREARRGDILRFDAATFRAVEAPAPEPPKRLQHSSKAARQAFQRLIEGKDSDRVAVPRTGIVDDAYLDALDVLNRADGASTPLEGRVESNPDDLSPA
jgi:hypothetical protein